MENISKILDRIQKLLALSTSSNQNEAASAAAKASQLMAEYELEEADLRIASGLANSDPIVKYEYLDEARQRVPQWESTLSKGLCESFGIHSWYQRTRVEARDASGYRLVDRYGYPKEVTVQRLRVVGRQDKVRTVRYLYNYLVNEINRICDEMWAKESLTTDIHGKSWKSTFKVMAAITVYNRLMEQKRTNDAVDCKAMVLVRKDQEEVDQAFKSLGLRLSKGQHAPVYKNGNAETLGRACGNSLNLAGGGKGLGAAAKQLTGL